MAKKKQSGFGGTTRRGKRVRITYVNRPVSGGFPKRLPFKLRYSDEVKLEPTIAKGGGAIPMDFKQFSCNSLFDPNRTDAGHQPMGYDQLSPHYNHWTVTDSHIKAFYIPNATPGNTSCVYYAIVVAPDLGDVKTTILNTTALMECSSRSKINVGGMVYRQNADSETISKSWNANSFFGTKFMVGDDHYQGDAGASPTEEAFFVLTVMNTANNASEALAHVFMVTIDYEGFFTEPELEGQS